jgi:hypothetical protein
MTVVIDLIGNAGRVGDKLYISLRLGELIGPTEELHRFNVFDITIKYVICQGLPLIILEVLDVLNVLRNRQDGRGGCAGSVELKEGSPLRQVIDGLDFVPDPLDNVGYLKGLNGIRDGVDLIHARIGHDILDYLK